MTVEPLKEASLMMMGVAALEVEMQADEAPLRATPLSCEVGG